jgi:hypothetical protein
MTYAKMSQHDTGLRTDMVSMTYYLYLLAIDTKHNLGICFKFRVNTEIKLLGNPGASCTGNSWVGLEGKAAGVWWPRRPQWVQGLCP